MDRRQFLRNGSLLGLSVAGSSLLSGCSSATAPVSTRDLTAGGIYSATLSPSGRFAILGSIEHGGSCWDLSSNGRLYDWNHKSGAYTNIVASAFSPQEEFAVTASSQDIVLWNLTSGVANGYWSAPAEILDIQLSPQGNFALLGCANHEAIYFDIKNGGVKQTLRHNARVQSVALNRDATIAIPGPDDYTSTSWDMGSGEAMHSLNFTNTIDTTAVSHDGRVAFSSAALDRAVIWDPHSGNIRHTLTGDESIWKKRVSYLCAEFSDDGQRLLTGTASGLIQLWSVSSGKQLKSWQAHQTSAYGPSSTSVYSVGFTSSARFYAIGANGYLNILA